MNRRELFRSTMTVGALAALAREGRAQTPLPGQTADSRVHPGEKPRDLAAADWKPVFFDAHQNQTLQVLADRIIPATDTPGASAARVNRFIDLLLSVEKPETQREFLAALAYLDGESQRRYRAPFAAVPEPYQNELLEFLSFDQGASGWTREESGPSPGHQHFLLLKDWISEAFYSSEIGMKSLGWDGEAIHANPLFGCRHEGQRKDV